MNKNWVTVTRENSVSALTWAKKSNGYITNDYAVIGGRTDAYQKGDDYDNFDFFFAISDVMKEFQNKFGMNK